MGENIEALAKVQQVALYLGQPWKFNHLYDSNWAFQIIDGEGRGLHLRPQTGGKLSISGTFSAKKTGRTHGKHKSIGVSISRDAKAIAADIERRLLPHYLQAFDDAVALHQKDMQREEAQNHQARALAKMAKGGRILGHGGQGSNKVVYFDHGKAEIYGYSGEVYLTLNRMTVEQAMKVIAVMNAEPEP